MAGTGRGSRNGATEAAKTGIFPDDAVRLKVKCNTLPDDLYFTIKRNTKMRRLLIAFCQRTEVDYRSTRFVFDERVFSHDRTPNQLGLKDEDQIDALVDGNGA